MHVGESLQVTGIRYGVDDTAVAEDGVVAFESYVRKEHGAVDGGSYDYTDGRFAAPVEGDLVGGSIVEHPGLESGWELDLVDNRIAVVAIRYFGNDLVVEDRMLIDVNVTTPPDQAEWTDSLTAVRGQWNTTEVEAEVDTSFDPTDVAGISVIETANPSGDLYEIGVKLKSVQEDTYANGFVVVDYRGENDFIYAGMRTTTDQWVIGHFDGQFNDMASLDQDIVARHTYDVRVAVDGSHVALASDGVFRISHDFARPLEGRVGLANQFAYTHFTEFNFFDNFTPYVESEAVVQLRDARDSEAVDVDQTRQNLDQARQGVTSAQAQRQEAAEAAEQAAAHAENLNNVAKQDELAVQQRSDERNHAQQELDAATETVTQRENDLQNNNSLINQTTQQIESVERTIASSRELLAEIGTPLREPIVIADEDFENGAADWSTDSTDSSEVTGQFLGRFGDGDYVEKSYQLPADANEIEISFKFLEIDSWDREAFYVSINDSQIDLGEYYWKTNEEGQAFDAGNGVSVQIDAAEVVADLGSSGRRSYENDNIHQVTITVLRS